MARASRTKPKGNKPVRNKGKGTKVAGKVKGSKASKVKGSKINSLEFYLYT